MLFTFFQNHNLFARGLSVSCLQQQQQHSLFSQASWGRLSVSCLTSLFFLKDETQQYRYFSFHTGMLDCICFCDDFHLLNRWKYLLWFTFFLWRCSDLLDLVFVHRLMKEVQVQVKSWQEHYMTMGELFWWATEPLVKEKFRQAQLHNTRMLNFLL